MLTFKSAGRPPKVTEAIAKGAFKRVLAGDDPRELAKSLAVSESTLAIAIVRSFVGASLKSN